MKTSQGHQSFSLLPAKDEALFNMAPDSASDVHRQTSPQSASPMGSGAWSTRGKHIGRSPVHAPHASAARKVASARPSSVDEVRRSACGEKSWNMPRLSR